MILLVATLAASCSGGGGSSGAGGGAGHGGAGTPGAGGGAAGNGGGAGPGGADGGGGTGGTEVDAAVLACPPCAADEGCLDVLVRRAADDSMLPWKISPGQVDGKGTLIASATSASVSRRATALADLTLPTGTYVLELGCLAAGSYQVTAFLDDDANASPTDTSSADPLDACGQTRAFTTPILAGHLTAQDFPLAVSCN